MIRLSDKVQISRRSPSVKVCLRDVIVPTIRLDAYTDSGFMSMNALKKNEQNLVSEASEKINANELLKKNVERLKVLIDLKMKCVAIKEETSELVLEERQKEVAMINYIIGLKSMVDGVDLGDFNAEIQIGKDIVVSPIRIQDKTVGKVPSIVSVKVALTDIVVNNLKMPEAGLEKVVAFYSKQYEKLKKEKDELMMDKQEIDAINESYFKGEREALMNKEI